MLGTTHCFCKAHSLCSLEGQYYKVNYATCIALFDAVLSTFNAADAKRDAMALKKWRAGIYRNTTFPALRVGYWFRPEKRVYGLVPNSLPW